ncbi:M14 family zinc carboxypeptidase [Sporosarcina pasteurii]|uniref:Zinc carboxypeptidase n=1 Tax=Sporosarcina pasteurii TaxID=1474 RepID=A0A380BIK1_SPOPA|nr:M14 family zinc carboxypeptidase [Sporosarcina pasteurii]MDS9470699.1 M14 family zinc carboxypeptidase [Sporosarcina pasteurii]QBQ05618.1 carboxypeptidase [Sporosarcina pasteurii]SUJ01651.1 Zinc carboxypeptidase precursor [Sporosarcina pasteurii]
MKKSLLALSMAGAMMLSVTPVVDAVGNGPNYGGNETVNTSILHTYDELSDFLQKEHAKQQDMELEVIGQTVKGRDLYLVKYMKNRDNPTILFLTQQHGNEQLTTEGALEFVKHLGTGKMKGVTDDVNILIVPMLNADGAMGDVDFSLDDYVASGDRNLTRYNALGIDLNRDHITKIQPETKALHDNVMRKYDIDYMIDLHHQGTQSAIDNEYVSGSILYPTTPNVDEDVVLKSKQLGAVVYDAIEAKGWGHLGKYNGGSAETISRNGIAVEYGISTLLFEMRGMSDHFYESYVLGQKSNGYLIKQTITTLDATVRAIADRSIETKDVSFWDTLPFQTNRTTE